MSFHYKFIKFLLLIGFIIPFAGCERKSEINEPDDGLSPVTPAGLRIYYAGDGNIGIEWIRNNEQDLRGYNVYKSVNDTDNFFFTGFTSDDFFVDDSLEYDSTYYYYLTAVDYKNQESPGTAVVSATPLNKLVPLTPRNVQINARNWNNRKEIFLWWDRGQETDIKGYNIYRSLSQDFNADSSGFLAFTPSVSYTDTFDLKLYQTYYYKVTAVDKGNLESGTQNELSDMILEVSDPVFPGNNSQVDYFEKFRIKAISVPAAYKIILQSNQYFDEIWSTEFNSTVINDTLDVQMNYWYLERNKTYYWRIITYSENSSEPNSISDLFNFTIKP